MNIYEEPWDDVPHTYMRAGLDHPGVMHKRNIMYGTFVEYQVVLYLLA